MPPDPSVPSDDDLVPESSILEGPFWPEPIRVIARKKLGRRFQIHGQGLQTRTAYDSTLTAEELKSRVKVTLGGKATYQGDASKFRLAIEAWRIRLAHEFDPHLAVSVSQIDPLPHQLEAVYHYILPRPRIRFLLADDPGAGKTIMAGLVLKELKLRGIVERTLIVTPAQLTDQWRRELKEKFGEVFQVVRRGTVDDLYGRNVWAESAQCITSIDFAKPSKDPLRNTVFESLREARWDLVITDEAHKMAAYVYGRETRESDRYRLGKVLSERADHFLMLTATPHKGDPENFRLLLQLLDREMFEGAGARDILKEQPIPMVLRRTKEEMVYFPAPGETKSRLIFRDRFVRTLTFQLSPQEQRLYDEVTDYVEEQSARAAAMGERGRLLGFTLALLQRRLASSVRAIRKSLERRMERLQEAQKNLREMRLEGIPEDPEDWEELTEEERWRVESKLEAVAFGDEREIRWECERLGRLIELARETEKAQVETKLQRLRDLLTEEGFFKTKTKLLLFTEHKDTLDYLLERFTEWGFSTTQIHGGMKLGDETLPNTRIWAEKRFKDPEGAQLMVATEAAGEGINLQFCWMMVNYDLPWNPNRLEQRMGRIHRYGQTKDVYVFNLVADQTREGQVMKLLLDKLEEIREAMGSDKVYDVISEVIPGGRLDQLFREALARQKDWSEVLQFVERNVSLEHVEAIRRSTTEALAASHIDLASIMAEDRKAKEQRLMPEYVERFFLDALRALGGAATRRQDGLLRVERVPYELQQPSPEVRRKYGPVDKEYRKVTFRKADLQKHSDATFMGPGHSLFETLIERVLQEYGPELRKGAVFYDPDFDNPLELTFHRMRVQDGMGNLVGSRLYAIARGVDAQPSTVPLGLLLDCKPSTPGTLGVALPSLQRTGDGDEALEWAYDFVFQPYLEEIRQRRLHELDVMARHLRLSLDTLIADSQSKLMRYRHEADRGRPMDVAIRQEEARKRDLEERETRRLREIALERNLALTTPETLGSAIILPMPEAMAKTGMKRDEEVERIAMEFAKAAEERDGRIPVDVSADNLGFDIRSSSSDGRETRYIEVKGRAGVGAIWLTPNEWRMAERFGADYWLYVVYNAGSNPQLSSVRDPVLNLPVVEEKEIVRYIVPPESVKKAAGAF